MRHRCHMPLDKEWISSRLTNIARKMTVGKLLKLSPAFPPSHTVRAAFTAHGVPSSKQGKLKRLVKFAKGLIVVCLLDLGPSLHSLLSELLWYYTPTAIPIHNSFAA